MHTITICMHMDERKEQHFLQFIFLIGTIARRMYYVYIYGSVHINIAICNTQKLDMGSSCLYQQARHITHHSTTHMLTYTHKSLTIRTLCFVYFIAYAVGRPKTVTRQSYADLVPNLRICRFYNNQARMNNGNISLSHEYIGPCAHDIN